MYQDKTSCGFRVWKRKLSTSIYDLVLIYVCHFHHHFLLLLQLPLVKNLTTIEILVLLPWIPASKEFWKLLPVKHILALTTWGRICTVSVGHPSSYELLHKEHSVPKKKKGMAQAFKSKFPASTTVSYEVLCTKGQKLWIISKQILKDKLFWKWLVTFLTLVKVVFCHSMTKSLKKQTLRDYFEQPLLALSEK